MDEESEEKIERGEKTVSVSINRFASGMSYRITVSDAKTPDDAVATLTETRKKILEMLQKEGEKIIEPNKWERRY